MIKVLIICKDILTAKSLVNNVISKNSNLRLVGIGNNLKEGMILLKKYEPKLIFTTSQKFLENLNKEFSTYTPGVVLIAKSNEDQQPKYRFQKLLLHIHNINDFELISEQTFRFVSENYTTSKKSFIKEILTDTGFDFKLAGTIYLQDAILYVNAYKGAHGFTNLASEIYPFIARKNKTKPDVVKWAITRSINYLYKKSDSDTLDKIESYFDIKYPKKVTPKIIINSIINMLEEE